MPQPSSILRIAIDTGGTFTDCVWIDRGRIRLLKLFSTPGRPGASHRRSHSPNRRRFRSHLCSTAPPSAPIRILQRKGARVALVTTKGFEDAIEIGRQARPKLYDFFFDRVEPLVPSDSASESPSAPTAKETSSTVPTRKTSTPLRKNIQRQQPDAIAISLLFSFANPGQ